MSTSFRSKEYERLLDLLKLAQKKVKRAFQNDPKMYLTKTGAMRMYYHIAQQIAELPEIRRDEIPALIMQPDEWSPTKRKIAHKVFNEYPELSGGPGPRTPSLDDPDFTPTGSSPLAQNTMEQSAGGEEVGMIPLNTVLTPEQSRYRRWFLTQSPQSPAQNLISSVHTTLRKTHQSLREADEVLNRTDPKHLRATSGAAVRRPNQTPPWVKNTDDPLNFPDMPPLPSGGGGGGGPPPGGGGGGGPPPPPGDGAGGPGPMLPQNADHNPLVRQQQQWEAIRNYAHLIGQRVQEYDPIMNKGFQALYGALGPYSKTRHVTGMLNSRKKPYWELTEPPSPKEQRTLKKPDTYPSTVTPRQKVMGSKTQYYDTKAPLGIKQSNHFFLNVFS